MYKKIPIFCVQNSGLNYLKKEIHYFGTLILKHLCLTSSSCSFKRMEIQYALLHLYNSSTEDLQSLLMLLKNTFSNIFTFKQ